MSRNFMDNYWTRIELPNSLVMGVQDVPTLTEERQEAMRGRTLNWVMGILIGVGLTAASAAEAQVALEVHGGVNVPTFKIADAAKLGPSGGAGLGYRLGERVWIMGEADFGFHTGAVVARDRTSRCSTTWPRSVTRCCPRPMARCP